MMAKFPPTSFRSTMLRLRSLSAFPGAKRTFLILCSVVTFAFYVGLSPQIGNYLPIWLRTPGIISSVYDLNSSVVCSPEVFRNYFRRRNHFPGGGRWVGLNSTLGLANFEPDLCVFLYTQLPTGYLENCLKQCKIKRIVTIGDSNAVRYYDAILGLLQDGGLVCSLRAEEKVDGSILRPDSNYYGTVEPRVMSYLRTSFRHCSSCASRSHICTSSGKDLDMEHLAMVSVLDSSLKLEIPHNHFVVNLRYRADTYQEYLVKYHLKRHVPDLLLIFPPFNHDHLTESVLSLEIRLRYFLDLVRLYLPRVKVIWVTAFREFESRKSRVWANRTSYGMLPTRKIDEFNKVLFKAIRRDLIRPNSSTFGFFDMIKVSDGLDNWSWDGIHMDEEWYKKIMSYLVQTFCSE